MSAAVRSPFSRRWIGLLGIIVLFVSGCSRDRAPYEIVHRAGSIKFEDGTPIPGEIVVRFYPQQSAVNVKQHPKPTTAEVGADGEFLSLTTWKYNDGITLGKHTVVILPPPNRTAAPSPVPVEFGSELTSPLVVEVLDDGAPLVIKIPISNSGSPAFR